MEVKDIIFNERTTRGLTMKELATLVGVSEATISRWESGDIENMRRDKVAKLSKVLDIPPEVLMGWAEYEPLGVPSVIVEVLHTKDADRLIEYAKKLKALEEMEQ